MGYAYQILMVVGAVGALIVIWLIPYLFVHAANVRRTHRVSAQPKFEPTTLEQLPIALRPRLAELIGQMQPLGFTLVANVTEREPYLAGQKTHCLFVNRDAARRAVIFFVSTKTKFSSRVFFVSEFSDGTTIKTTQEPAVQADTASHEHFIYVPATMSLEVMYARHQAATAEFAPREATPILPPEGHEAEYITGRHAMARTQLKTALGFTLDETGTFYRPTWRRALQIAATKHPIVGKFVRHKSQAR
jgi:hypothetical protein